MSVLTRSRTNAAHAIHWDGSADGTWANSLSQNDAVVNACGLGLEHWPWTPTRKRQFVDSRVVPGKALASAIAQSNPRPLTFIQFSGINRYGLAGDAPADETTPVADDFLAQLTEAWEDSTLPIEELGVRRVIIRNAIVLDRREGLFPLMCLPARNFLGGRLGDGRNAVPWIHVSDHVRAVSFLLERQDAAGAYNLVAPGAPNNAQFMRAICAALRRPYWLHAPAVLMRMVLGEMADLVLKGRASAPRRLLEAGFEFEFSEIQAAMRNLLAVDFGRGSSDRDRGPA